MRHFWTIALLSCGLLPVSMAQTAGNAAPPFHERMADAAVLAQLKQGGLVMYMRHGNTDNSRADAVPQVDLKDCRTQRVLNEEGRKVATEVGRAIQKAGIPIGEIVHSPMCRVVDTVQLAFGALKVPVRADINLMYTANLTTEEKKPVLLKTRLLLGTPVPVGTNRVVVAHAPNMADLIGYFVKPEGTVVVIRPLADGSFEYVASIPPKLWSQLLK